VRLTYVNASPENEFGYNSMASRQEKLDYFDRFLGIVAERFAPDQILIACNTLSVLLPDTGFGRSTRTPVCGIVEAGITRLLNEIGTDRNGAIVIFGTPTTIDEQTYSSRLIESGIEVQRIVNQSCPGLADIISEDLDGASAEAEISRYVRSALDRVVSPARATVACLACTHYGYRKSMFSIAFAAAGHTTRVLNPNEFIVDDMLGPRTGDCHELEVEFVTRYRIPETALKTITFFLGNTAPATVRAFRNFTHVSDLF
jgi:glutamate racemase